MSDAVESLPEAIARLATHCHKDKWSVVVDGARGTTVWSDGNEGLARALYTTVWSDGNEGLARALYTTVRLGGDAAQVTAAALFSPDGAFVRAWVVCERKPRRPSRIVAEFPARTDPTAGLP